jgi:MFS family permease
MLKVFTSVWALLLGMCLLMIGNGMQGTLLGIRGGIEDFSTFQMSIVMSAYFAGFLGGSRMAPGMIRRVGHVRVFAAVASLISAVMILYPTFPNIMVWSLGRVLIGFCFSVVYVTAESWLNNAATNENRGQALSLYMIVQTAGIVIAQALLLTADPSGFVLFVIPSVLVSLAVTPILLAVSPTPAFDTTKPMSLSSLMTVSPLGCVGMFLLGGVFSAQFGMASVYGAEAGLTVAQISIFVAVFFVGSMVLQYPIGWISDRMDRRLLIVITAAIGFAGSILGMMMGHVFPVLLVSAFVVPALFLADCPHERFSGTGGHGCCVRWHVVYQRVGRDYGSDHHGLDDGHDPWAGGLLSLYRSAVCRLGPICILPCHGASVDRGRRDQPVRSVFGSHSRLGGRSCP